MPRTLFLITLVLALILSGCGDDNGGENGAADEPEPSPTSVNEVDTATPTDLADTPTATETSPQPSATEEAGTGDDEAAVNTSVDRIMDAVRMHDRDRLHDMTGDHLHRQDRDRDMDHLATCLPDGAHMEIVEREVEIDGNSATVAITMEVTDEHGETETYERVWEFERDDDGTWVLSEIPDCRFHDVSEMARR